LWIFLRLGTFLELFFNSGGLFAKLWTAGQFQRNHGPLCKIPEITDFWI
jgi:hypothetical protein